MKGLNFLFDDLFAFSEASCDYPADIGHQQSICFRIILNETHQSKGGALECYQRDLFEEFMFLGSHVEFSLNFAMLDQVSGVCAISWLDNHWF